MVEKHPIDFDKYDRGDLIPIDLIKQAAKADGVESDKLTLYMMSLSERLKQHMLESGKGLVSITSRGGLGLRILKDGSDTTNYCRLEKRKSMRKFMRRQREQAAVNHMLLNPEEQKRHFDDLIRGSRILGEAGYPKRALPPIPKVIEEASPTLSIE